MHHTLPYPRDTAQFFRALLAFGDAPAWLDGDAEGSRYSVMAVESRVRLRLENDVLIRDRDGLRDHFPPQHAARLLRESRHPPASAPRGPFASGWIGFFGYDYGRRLMGLPGRGGGLPELALNRYDWVVVLDHRDTRAWLDGPGATPALARRVAECAAAAETPAPPATHAAPGPVRVDLDEAAYREAFERVRAWIRDGDCYQVNLARAFRAPFGGDSLSLYAALRGASPAPFGACLDFGDLQVLSVSPERFLRLETDGAVETAPIKGTTARCPDPDADRRARDALAASGKDRAENVMIVDLLRNDLGRVCRTGSIEVPQVCALETHPTVHHLVSRVRGRLERGRDALDLLAACLPGGSITGAPKRRAMEIIDELEPTPRGVYCGAIGYLGDDGAMDTSIAIRTAVVQDGEVEYRAGGGLTWPSVCDAEFAETDAKAAAFLGLVGPR